MSWLVTLIAGICGMLSGGLGMFAIAHACVKWYRISSFEGGSGYFIVGLTILGGIAGFGLSIIAARLAYSFLGTPWYTQVGAASATVATALAVVGAIAYTGVDREPTVGGQGIDSVWEIRLPIVNTDESAAAGDPRNWSDDELRLELVSVMNHKPRGSRMATFDRHAFRQENGQWILPARVPLFSSKGEYCVNLSLGSRDDGFWPAVGAASQAANFEWSHWARTNKGSKQPDDAAACMYRFKFEKSTD